MSSVRAACVLALRDELILAVETGHRPGELSLPGGKVDPGEEPLQAAAREALEEASVRVALAPDPIYVGPVTEGGPIVATFLVRSFEGEPRPASDAVAVRWVTAAELLEAKNRYADYNRKVLAAFKAVRP